MEIKRKDSRPLNDAPMEYFSGTVHIDPLFAPPEPSRVAMAWVTFEAGARTAWHTHPVGQTLIFTDGSGWVQRKGGAIEEVHAGDVVWFEPNEIHWHGATATTSATHIAIQEKMNGSAVTWSDKVTDKEYDFV